MFLCFQCTGFSHLKKFTPKYFCGAIENYICFVDSIVTYNKFVKIDLFPAILLIQLVVGHRCSAWEMFRMCSCCLWLHSLLHPFQSLLCWLGPQVQVWTEIMRAYILTLGQILGGICLLFYHVLILVYPITVVPIFPPLPSSTQPTPSSHMMLSVGWGASLLFLVCWKPLWTL